ncbi:MAG: DMT family transporter [Alphaproteobacteria bacterium]|nr:DMT family transporter [Alphaproteobacteria bacterium]
MNASGSRQKQDALNPLLPVALLLVLGALWSLGPSATKFVAINGVPPIGMVFWQTFIAGTLLLLICRGWKISIGLDKRHLRYYAVMGSVGVALPNANMVFVMRDLPAGLMSVVIVTAPLITYVIALAVRIEHFRFVRAGGVLLGFAGVAVLVLPKGSLPSPDLLPIALLAIVTPTLWSISNVFAETARPEEGNNISLAMGTMFVAAATSLVLAIPTGTFHPIWDGFGPEDWVILAYGVVTVATFVLFYTVVSLAGAVYLAQVGYVVVLTGIGWGALFYGERPSVWLWASVVLVFAGVALVNFSRGRAEAGEA